MRIRHFVILVVVLLASSIIGQDEPLPAVVSPATQPVLVALAVEPAIEVPPPTLADAARANDYVTFAALYEKTKDAAYAPLHELWTYSVNDPIGAFYGAERYDTLARAYPAFAAYIEEYRIVDMRGNVFYPTSETRRFLLARALEGVRVTVPKVDVARVERNGAPAASRPVRRLPGGRQDAGGPAGRMPALRSGASPAVAPVAPPVTVAEIAPLVAVAPALEPPPPAVAAQPKQQNTFAGRGILLVIFGLIGIGLLALIMRTPSEPTVINPRRDP